MDNIERELDEKIKQYDDELRRKYPYADEWNAPSAFLDLPKDEQIKLYTWCKYLPKIKSINRAISSYGLKHVYERNTGNYVYNGAFKGAMLLSGFKVANILELNWCFNVSKKIYKTTTRRTSESVVKAIKVFGMIMWIARSF